MDKIPGERKNTFVYIYEQYMYYKVIRQCNAMYYYCVKNRTLKCKGSLKEDLSVKHAHNHPAEPQNVINEIKIKAAIKEMCRKYPHLKCKQIFDILSENHDIPIEFKTIKSSLHRWRRIHSAANISQSSSSNETNDENVTSCSDQIMESDDGITSSPKSDDE